PRANADEVTAPRVAGLERPALFDVGAAPGVVEPAVGQALERADVRRWDLAQPQGFGRPRGAPRTARPRTAGQPPQPYRPLRAARGGVTSVRREGDRSDVMGRQPADEPTGCHLPVAHRVVVAARQGMAAVRREGDGGDVGMLPGGPEPA